jgi:hypothetical protein
VYATKIKQPAWSPDGYAKAIKLFKGQMIIIFPEVFVFFFFFLRLVVFLVAFCQHAPPLGVLTSSPSDVLYT